MCSIPNNCREFLRDFLNVKVFPTTREMGCAAAGEVAAKIVELLGQKEEVNMIFAAAPSQEVFLESLIADSRIDWTRINAFHMDEYIGLPGDAPQGFGNYLRRAIFERAPFRSVHYIDGQAAPEEACSRYSELLKEYPADIVFMGIGENGHIAFNEPGSSLTSRTRMKSLTTDTIIANSRFFNNDMNQVPKTALTVGVGTIMDAKEVLILVNGHNKARALYQAVEGSVNHMWTVSVLQMHPKGIIVCDDAATVELKVGTVVYFKDIERNNLNPASML